MLLGKSLAYKEILAADKTEGRLVLAALYLLLLLPISMIFARTAAEIISGLIGVLFLFHSYRLQNWKWLREPPVVIALLLWLYSVLLVSPFALDPRASFSRADWIRFIPMFAAIVYWLSSYHQELRKIAKVMVWALILAGIDGIYQYCTGFSLAGTPYEQERLTGPFKKVVIGIYTAKLSFPFLGILFYYVWRENKKWMKMVLLAALLFCFTVILLSNERTATLTFSIAMLFTAVGFFFVFRKTRALIFALLLLTAGGVIFAYQSQPALQKRLHVTHEMVQDFSNSEYAQLWKASILLWQDHPITGVGMLNFRSACPALLEQGRVLFCNAHSHNLYLEVLSEFGTIGFMLMLMLVVSLITVIIEQHSSHPRERWVLTFFAAAGLFINFFPLAPTQSFFSSWPALLAWQSIAWSLAIVRGGKEQSHG